MQDIDQHMDDLLRKAAENYPLKTGDGNWDAVAARLTGPATPKAKNNNARKYGLSTLFLLMFLFTADIFIRQQDGRVKTSGSAVDNTMKDKTSQQTNNPTPFQIKQSELRTAVSIDHKVKETNAAITNAYDWNVLQATTIPSIMRTTHDAAIVVNAPDNPNAKQHLKAVIQTGTDQTGTDTNSDKLMQSTTSTSNSRQRGSGLYIGLASGPEFNQVKNQGLEKTGFDVGMIAGYQFNKKLSVETGLFFSKKYYFSDGKYFNMDMPGMKVVSLEGSCAVLELPLKFKYGVFTRKKMTVFSSAGISSYMLMKEKNNYLTEMNGTRQRMVSSYKETCRYFAATVDLSIGYEHRLGTSTNLRIEPYLQVPLQGIGVGTMPVKSAGLHIGLIRSLH